MAAKRLNLVVQTGNYSAAPLAAAWSSKDERVAVATAIGQVQIYESTHGDLLTTLGLEPQDGELLQATVGSTVEFSPDGRSVFVSTTAKRLVRFDGYSAQRIASRTLSASPSLVGFVNEKVGVLVVNTTPNEKDVRKVQMAVEFFDTATLGVRRTIRLPRYVFGASISPDGARIAVAVPGQREIRIYRTSDGQLIQSRPFALPIQVEYLKSGSELAVLRLDSDSILILDSGGLKAKRQVPIRRPVGRIYDMDFSADGSRQILKLEKDSIVQGPNGVRRFNGNVVRFSSLGNTLVQWDSESGDNEARIEPADRKRAQVPLGGRSSFTHAAFGARGGIAVPTRMAALLFDDSTGRIKTAITNDLLAFDSRTMFLVAGQSPSNRLFYAGDNAGRVVLHSTERDIAPSRIFQFGGKIRGVQFDNEERRMYVSDGSSSIHVVDLESGEKREIALLDNVMDLEISPDTSTGASAIDPDGGLKGALLWPLDAAGGESKLLLHPDGVFGTNFSPDGKWLVTACKDGHVRIWDVKGQRVVKEWKAHERAVTKAVFLDAGRKLITVSWDQTAVLWDTQTKAKIRNFPTHSTAVIAASVSPDEKRLLTSCQDGTLYLWDIGTGDLLMRWIVFDDGSWTVLDPSGSGIYDASGEVSGLHWVLDGREPISLEQLRAHYQVKGLWESLLERKELPKVPDLQRVALFPQWSSSLSGDFAVVKLRNLGGGIGRTSVRLNGREVALFNADPNHPDFDPNLPSKELRIDLKGIPRRAAGNVVDVAAWNSEGSLRSRATLATAAESRSAKPPSAIFAVISGVAHYAESSLDLDFSGQDALDMTQMVKLSAKGLGIKPTVYLLCDDPRAAALAGDGVTVLPPSRQGFDRAFAELATKGRMKESDLLLVYLSGHGTSIDQGRKRYLYLTKDARSVDGQALANEAARRLYTISDDDIVRYLRLLPAEKRVLILDTCSAGALNDKVSLLVRNGTSDDIVAANELRDRIGVHALMATAAGRYAYEAPEFGHGFLTYALLWNLAAKPLGDDLNVPDAISVTALFQAVRTSVPTLASWNGRFQQPEVISPSGSTFPIGLLDKSARAQIGRFASTRLHLVARPRLFNPQANDDDLELSDAVAARFRQLFRVAEGGPTTRPTAIFVDSSVVSNSVMVSGSYTVVGGEVRVELDLKRGRVSLNSERIVVQAPKSEIVARIVDKVIELLQTIPVVGHESSG